MNIGICVCVFIQLERGYGHMTFLMQKFNIVFDGLWQVNEIAAAAAAVIIVMLLILAVILAVRKIAEDVNPRKSTIFSHRKNKYKSRIGKNNSKYLK